ncbi:protein translocase subunit SecB [Gluconacetobacter johannae DSM 13595]|uniref:Protein-export chaperone SecB n=1 Tax=Gluconacetobacter johannae TaxID=112140 RepID=A0A7W4P462_9PROT|nr:protein-export chaperone SecB [Gluconacetobacter johannae]MBB2174703.1 protein-export chaperone SecB [Gluconacetobacter johannae]GBQ86748.1 protein translocase subunit SecB [Gluconacetobacter johannae DSM 13595]
MTEGHAVDTLPGGASSSPPTPRALIVSQYVKSVAFAVPAAPGVHAAPKGLPALHLDLDVDARQVEGSATLFEVALTLRCRANASAGQGPPRAVFEADIAYAALVSLQGATPAALEPLLLIEVPAMIFPAARNVLADLTREAGFAPVLMQQVDFAALYRIRRAAA